MRVSEPERENSVEGSCRRVLSRVLKDLGFLGSRLSVEGV